MYPHKMYPHKSLGLLVVCTIGLTVLPASAMQSHHDAVTPLTSVFQAASVFRTHAPQIHAPQILFAQAQAPGRPLTQREQETTRAPERPVRDPLVRVEPPPPQQPGNPFPPRPANEPRLTNPLSR